MTLIINTGDRFGLLTAVAPAENDRHGNRRFLWKCDCGAERVIAAFEVKRGHSQSCGCLKIRTTHGESRVGRISPEYRTWIGLHQRCGNPSNTGYASYGGRGIAVCERWFKFELFLEDMGRRPGPECQLDRIDNASSYSKENCRWVLPVIQANNRRDNIPAHLRTERHDYQRAATKKYRAKLRGQDVADCHAAVADMGVDVPNLECAAAKLALAAQDDVFRMLNADANL